MDKTIIKRLEHLEGKNLATDGVALLVLLADGDWELSFGRSKSTYSTMEEGQRAYKERLQKSRKTEKDSVLIICDI